ncbi:MAG TPA: helix-turn-helix domain-containing protein [Flavisolibacter sp.]|nr:helix-turn-helix domain-containing protein [Flavisolibacter sp.]
MPSTEVVKKDQFITLKPANPVLQPYIAYYYFHTSLDPSLQKSFIYYPSLKNALTIYRHARARFDINYSCVEPDEKNDFIFLYSGIQKYPRKADMIAPFDKAGIVFKELGINAFLSEPLGRLTSQGIDKSFNHFGDELIDVCKAVYAAHDPGRKVRLLDSFFERRLLNFPEDALKECVRIVSTAEQKTTVEDLSKHVHLSRKTIQRLFQKHLGCTAKDYIDIAHFRKSLNSYILQNEKPSLTQTALENGYYDHAQFIKHFQKLAAANPKSFFRSVQQIGGEDTFWTLIDE